MINIDEVCKDGEAKHYAAILYNNAAMILLAGTPTEDAIETPGGSLVGYNVYKSDEYKKMEDDPSLPESIKSKLREEHNPSLEAELTARSLEGCHVLRTPTPLAGDQLKAALTAIQKTLDSQFSGKFQGLQPETVRDSLVMEEVYRI